MTSPLLSETEITEILTELPDWTRRGEAITRTVEAPTFLSGIELVRRVGDIAEANDHHPDIDIRWRRLTFTLSTHSAGGLTSKDVRLAREIDRLASATA
ncbi:4a-hydroxytetrahydrobiopterin dehydratase [Nocardia callitridis]|uniref:Putative pterin-4-alpha-carbinolamine dehydratase n=1 Tax=Nocardia callitridis TaxID=648753 RepID=A0ABP9JU50_9NOCA